MYADPTIDELDACLKAAANQITEQSIKEWVLEDSSGSLKKQAKEIWTDPRRKDLPVETVIDAIGDFLSLEAFKITLRMKFMDHTTH